MPTSFLISLDENEFKEFLKNALKEILGEKNSSNKSGLPDVLNIAEASAFLKMRINTLYQKTSRKIIPHFKKGNKLYFKLVELQDWITKGKVKTREETEGEAVTFLLTRKEKRSSK